MSGNGLKIEGLKVGEEDISGRIQRLASSIQDPEGNFLNALNTPRSRRRIENDLLFEMAIDRLVSIAKGEKPDKGNPALEPLEIQETEEEAAILDPEPELEKPEEDEEKPLEGSPESEVLEIQESESDSIEE